MRKFNSEIIPGRALVACTNEGIYATACRCEKLKLSTVTPDGTTVEFESSFLPHELNKIASEGGYFAYIVGVAAYIATYYDIGGIELDCHTMTLPQKKGLSSSAAICVLAARAFNRLYGLNLTLRGEMEAAYHGELLTPSRCGRLDQSCAYGKGIIHMRFDSDKLDANPIKIGAPLHFVFADLKAEKNTIAILRDLNVAYPYPSTNEHRDLHDLLGKYNDTIINDAIRAMKDGDSARIGELMNFAQEQFNRYAVPLSPIELKAEKLRSVLSDPNLYEWIYGGKGVGSQGDGSIQFIAKNEECQVKLKKYLTDNLGLDCYTVTIPKTQAVRKAVIPVAGYGTRMYPATKVIKKEFFPVIDTDGYAKPALLIILEELLNSGITEICLVIRPGEENLYLSLFEKLQKSNEYNLPDSLKAFENKLSAIQEKVVFAYQEQMLGFGDAVLKSEVFSAGEPVLLVLGDHLYRSSGNTTCSKQMIDAYEKTEKLTVGLFEISLEDTPKYGVAKGSITTAGEPAKLHALTEKPSAEYAKSYLGINGKQYGVFMYVLTPDVYKVLIKQFTQNKTEFGEFQLTPALDAIARKTGAFGVMINGERFDIGMPKEYRHTVANYSK
jgi:UTP-glucose-1-phosphate uridylyltransferase/mevalonate kinase